MTFGCVHIKQEKTLAPLNPELYSMPTVDKDHATDIKKDNDKKDDIHNSYYHFLLGVLRLLESSPQEAHKSFESNLAIKSTPESVIHLINAKIMSHQMASAINLAHQAVLMYPRSGELLIMYAKLLLFDNKLSKARQYLYKALKLKTLSTSQYRLGYQSLIETYINHINHDHDNNNFNNNYNAKKNYQKALELALEFKNKYPYDVYCFIILAKIYIKLKDFENAENISKKGLDIEDSNANLLLIRAYSLAKLGNTVTSQRLYENLHKKVCCDLNTFSQIVAIYQEFHGTEDAYETLDNLTKSYNVKNINNQHNAASFINIKKEMIIIRLSRQDFKAALHLINELKIQDIKDNQLYFLEATCYWSLNQFDLAIDALLSISYKSALTVNAKITAANLVVSTSKDLTKAIMIIEKLLANAVASHELYDQAANFYKNIGFYDAALTVLDIAQKKFQNNSHFSLFKAFIYYDLKNFTMLEKTLVDIIKTDQKNHQALNFLGYYYTERQKLLEYSHDLIKNALRLDPLNPAYIDSLGWNYFMQKRYKKAQTWLIYAQSLAKYDPTINEHLADSYLKNRECILAQKHYKISLENFAKIHNNDISLKESTVNLEGNNNRSDNINIYKDQIRIQKKLANINSQC